MYFIFVKINDKFEYYIEYYFLDFYVVVVQREEWMSFNGVFLLLFFSWKLKKLEVKEEKEVIKVLKKFNIKDKKCVIYNNLKY